MAIITGIDGMRAIAARSKRYRPDEDEPQFEYDSELKGPLNPLGLVRCALKIYMRDEGGETWRPVSGYAYWDEFAAVKDEWGEDERTGKRKPTGEQSLEGNWSKMGRVMLAKCAEGQALRKAFPEDLSSLYERAELDKALAADFDDFSPTEMVQHAGVEDRLNLIGGKDCILFQMEPKAPLLNIPIGAINDRVEEITRAYGTVDQLDWFEGVNRESLRDFWARSPGDALALKKFLEDLRAKLVKGA